MRLKIDDLEPMGAVRTTQRQKYKDERAKRYKRYKRAIRLHAKQLMGHDDPTPFAVAVDIQFIMPIPKSGRVSYKDHTTGKRKSEKVEPGDPHLVKPDLDNLIKGVFDSINKVVWVDDNQVMQVNAQKVYGEQPGIIVDIKALF